MAGLDRLARMAFIVSIVVTGMIVPLAASQRVSNERAAPALARQD